ncbi:hypothetical protein [Frateuria aurantia]|uniref:Dicarboxylate transport n=1 Tax=Frateuria aurantia (strain ATCC 33424 / DSM 6220 / KCTC 2777 / LMG 1558 / NBRC 3245 / NCIMB 13370) TaxID=767434 RepID=H8KYA2_FRAAD|nr:hypothetical protein [Frateuria aurantia]AFC86096.1 hypothetical protein Fraau_1685 [Frateuria aurantia DSM 6220]
MLLLLWCSPGWADTVVSLRHAHWPGVEVQGLQARLGRDDAGQPGLVMRIAQLSIDRLGWRGVGVQMNGRLTSEPGGRWRFVGGVACHGAPGGAWDHAQLVLVVDTLANSLFANLLQDQSRFSAALPLDQPSHWQISMDQLPAAWLHPGGGGGRESLFGKGVLSGELALDLNDDGLHESGIFHGRDISLNLPGIGFSGVGLDGTAQLNAQLDAGGHLQQARLQAVVQRGHWNLQGWQAQLSDGSAVHLGLDADAVEHGGVALGLRWIDPQALRFDGRLQFDARGRVRELSLVHLNVDLASAWAHYGGSLDGTAWAGPLQASGQIDGALDWRASGWRALALHFRDVAIQGEGLPLSVQGLQGTLDWRLHGLGPMTRLDWKQVALGGAVQAAGQLQSQSRDGQWRLLTPLSLSLWGGQLRFNALALSPQSGSLQGSAVASVQGLHLDQPARAWGLPGLPVIWSQSGVAMHGNLRQWSFDTPLQAELWGGPLLADRIRLSRPDFTQPMQLAGDLQFQQIDLQALGSSADLGPLTGRVQGRVDGLRLQQGGGVQAFHLNLRSDGGGRLSQRAVMALSALSGSGASSGLQGMMLHVFRSPPYVRLGIDARLADGVLYLDGMDHDDHGYTLVEGRGLPFVRLTGHDTRLPWVTALRRLRAAGGGRQSTR